MVDEKYLHDVIKNPQRKEYTEPFEYVPEYVRLGIDPVPQNFGAQEEFPSLDGKPMTDEVYKGADINSPLNSHILDNNEYVNFGFQHKQKTKKENPNIGEFVLMVKGKILGYGSNDYILTQARSILYGEHPSFHKEEVPIEDIIILKRVGLKVGVFLDE